MKFEIVTSYLVLIEYENDEGWEVTAKVPGKKVTCDDCNGKGSTYLGWTSSEQPSFSREDFDQEGPDFQEDYMAGCYDKMCPTCKGETTVVVIDREACTKEHMVAVKAYDDGQEALAEMYAEMEAERRMGC